MPLFSFILIIYTDKKKENKEPVINHSFNQVAKVDK